MTDSTSPEDESPLMNALKIWCKSSAMDGSVDDSPSHADKKKARRHHRRRMPINRNDRVQDHPYHLLGSQRPSAGLDGGIEVEVHPLQNHPHARVSINVTVHEVCGYAHSGPTADSEAYIRSSGVAFPEPFHTVSFPLPQSGGSETRC